MKRGSGVLLHISSLPGPYGLGCFGEEALTFVHSLKKAGMTYWQVLPFSVPGSGNSPYMSLSAFAGNPMLIDPDSLFRQGLITEEERAGSEIPGDPYVANFSDCKKKRSIVLRKAYSRITGRIREEVESFIREQDWVDDLALFLLIRNQNDGKYWWEWEDEDLRRHDSYSLAAHRDRFRNEYLYYCFVQYLFFSQWSDLKKEINRLGIQIIGDIPIYVSRDSVDVWAHRKLFRIDDRLVFPKVAGVPPDYFTSKGQLWGNPLYDWKKHADEDYRWWRSRLSNNFEIYDLLRIDHFRGFSSYWSVSSDREDAVIGEWESGPGVSFFDRLRLDFPEPAIFAEDLGEPTEDLTDFLDKVGFPGMRVFQFGFEGEADNKHRPHDYPKACVAYSGTHDNDTLIGWYRSLPEKNAEVVLDYLGLSLFPSSEITEENISKSSTRAIIGSPADLVIFPVQDLLHMNSSRRMNIPGTRSGNWAVRFTREELDRIDARWIFRMNRLCGRI